MNTLRARMIDDLQLHGLSKSTQVPYAQAVRHLAEYYRKPPDQIAEEELRQYFLHLTTVKKVSPNTLRVALCGIKFLIRVRLILPKMKYIGIIEIRS